MTLNWRRNIVPILLTLVLGLTAMWQFRTPQASSQEVRDCDDNAVIRCGAVTEAELKTKYRENQAGNVQALYRQFNIPDEAALTGLVEGRVDTQNNVYVGDRLVGRNAITAGRQNISNSRGSSTAILDGAFYKRPPSVSFADPNGSLRALVKMDNKNFRFAVITSCGNPVNADVVQPPPPPPPPPTPVRPDFNITKYVRSAKENMWQQDVSVASGDEVQFRVVIDNTGDTDLTNIIVKDVLPSGLTLDASSVKLRSGTTGNMFSAVGANIGSLAVDQSTEIFFDATVKSGVSACRDDRLVNIARAKPDNLLEEEDDATVQVCPKKVVKQVLPTKTTTKKTLVASGTGQLSIVFAVTVLLGTTLRYLVDFYQHWLRRFGY